MHASSQAPRHCADHGTVTAALDGDPGPAAWSPSGRCNRSRSSWPPCSRCGYAGRACAGASEPWPRWRIGGFAARAGVAGVDQLRFPRRSTPSSLYWVWTTQTLTLWLVVPILRAVRASGAAGACRGGRGRVVDRVLALAVRPGRSPTRSSGRRSCRCCRSRCSSARCPAGRSRWPAVGWVLQLVLLVVGALMVLPLVGLDEDATSLAVGLCAGDRLVRARARRDPRHVLRLQATPGDVLLRPPRRVHRGRRIALHDQRIAGAILWCVAELIDLPFLLLVFRRWLRADARDAAEVDAVLEAERAARAA